MNARTIDLIDIGVNLTHDSFDRDRDEVLARAANAGVRRMIVTGTTVAASRQALELARQRGSRIRATAGVHPHHASEVDAAAREALGELVREPEVVAVGECGLDYFRDFSPRDAQRDAFAAQLDLAAGTDKPVFLHQRDAHDDFVAILRDRIDTLAGGVAHCFTGGPDEMQEYLAMGLHIGITGWICDERRGRALQAAVRDLPLDRVLLETDAPYLVPRDLPIKPRGRRNEPAFLRHVLDATARCMNRDPAELAAAATANTERLFGLPV
ncbi:MAG: TatD family hydrolase [Gammaproteobacteria bacterium]|nr:TatD family hydrolase [Gammaproteobacteria bacterium]